MIKKWSVKSILLVALVPTAMILFSSGEAQATVVDFNYTGSIVDYSVRTTGIYDITAYGAQGGGGGYGAKIGGDLSLTKGDVLQILAGGFGRGGGGGGGAGGGGGSFVALGNSYKNATPLVVAGGGGGGSFNSGCGGEGCGTTHTPFPGYINPSGDGFGGSYNGGGEGGGGFYLGGKGGGGSFISGGGGGVGNGGSAGSFYDGGFGGGGGGGGGGEGYLGGGGGGYSGGPGSNSVEYSGGGGSSYFDTVIGSETIAIAGGNHNLNGLVTLSFVSPTPSLTGTPEPSTWLLFGTGVVLMGAMGLRNQKERLNKA